MKNMYIPQGQFSIICCLLFLFTFSGFSQVGIGTTNPNPNALLDIDASTTTGGLLLPRVSLSNSTSFAPMSGHVAGMTVYNTATAGDVTPGYYYNDGAQWVRLAADAPSSDWSRLGNLGTNPALNFIGTTDNQPLAFRVNNSEQMGILTNGNVGMGGYYNNVKLNITGGTNTYGIYSIATQSGARAIFASTNQDNGLGVMATNSSTNSSTGIVGIGNNSASYSTGGPGTGIAGTAAQNGYGVMGSHFNGINANRFGVLGAPNYGVYSNFGANNFGWMNSATDGLYTQRNNNNFAALASILETSPGAGDVNVGTFTGAGGNTYNVGLFVDSGETVISVGSTNNNPTLPRTFNGSIFLQKAASGGVAGTRGRIFFTAGNVDYYVNSSGAGDYSEYFKTSDRTLGVGEIVAMDPNNASGVRRARPSDVSKTVGIVSIGGTRNNDNIGGTRGDDQNYTNVGLLGQVPVLVTTENGNIKPGDPLTLSKIYRGRAVKATESSRIIGYALTHFPYVSGEQTYETDINGTDKLKLRDNHVMCYVNPVWYEPADENLGDGIEIIPSESAFNMTARVNNELDIENPKKGVIRDRPKFNSDKKEMILETTTNSSEVKLEEHQKELNSNNLNVENSN